MSFARLKIDAPRDIAILRELEDLRDNFSQTADALRKDAPQEIQRQLAILLDTHYDLMYVVPAAISKLIGAGMKPCKAIAAVES
jgi:hypothetical protein